MRKLLPLLAFLLILLSCKKDKQKNNYTGNDKVEFYLLETMTPVTNKCAIDGSRSTLKATPFITNEEIVVYDQKKHEFKFTADTWQKLETLKDWDALAITMNKEVIYFAIFKPGHSSSSCDHSITAAKRLAVPRNLTEQVLSMSLGYPGNDSFPGIEDKRNDKFLLHALYIQGKLL